MAHPQSTPRGYVAHKRVDVGANQLTGNSTSLILSAGIQISNKSTAVLTGNTTATVFSGGIKVSNKQTLTGNSTGLVFGNPVSALPGNVDNGVLIGVGSNSTGVFLFINSTGTTHKYLNVTSVQPT